MSNESKSDLGELRDRVGKLEQSMAENTAATNRIESNVSEIVDLFRLSKGGFRVLGHIGSVLKWVMGIAASIAALWFTIKGGVK